jgi:glycosyltransferase involved in cell wall biosynthesis
VKDVADMRVVFISHAGIKQINRAVYRLVKNSVSDLQVIIPSALILGSGKRIEAEPATSHDPTLVKLELIGRNPRLYYYKGLEDFLRVFKPTIIVLENDPVSRLGFELSRWCSKHSTKLVCQSYENVSRSFSNTLRYQGWKAMFRNTPIHLLNYVMAKRVDGVLVVNHDSEVIFSEYGYPKVTRIPLGYDKNVFFEDSQLRNECRLKLNLSHNKVLIAFFGRLVREKGVHLLIEALSQLQDHSWSLLLDHLHDSNDGYAEEIRELIIQRGLSHRVMYFSADHFEIANYMRAADLMIAPSLVISNFKEQYGRAIQEAMACGCVCLVSNSGNLPDLVGDISLVFEQNNVLSLRDKLLQWLDDKGKMDIYRKTMTDRAQCNFTTEKQALALVTLVSQLHDKTNTAA